MDNGIGLIMGERIDYSETLSKPVRQPDFLPGQKVFALMLPKTRSMLSDIKPAPFSIMEVVIESVWLSSD